MVLVACSTLSHSSSFRQHAAMLFDSAARCSNSRAVSAAVLPPAPPPLPFAPAAPLSLLLPPAAAPMAAASTFLWLATVIARSNRRLAREYCPALNFPTPSSRTLSTSTRRSAPLSSSTALVGQGVNGSSSSSMTSEPVTDACG